MEERAAALKNEAIVVVERTNDPFMTFSLPGFLVLLQVGSTIDEEVSLCLLSSSQEF